MAAKPVHNTEGGRLSAPLPQPKEGKETLRLHGQEASRRNKEELRSMSAFTSDKREETAPREEGGQQAPSTPVGKETNNRGGAEGMAIDDVGGGKSNITPSSANAAGAKAQGGKAAGSGGKTGSGSKKRASTEASLASKKAEQVGACITRRGNHLVYKQRPAPRASAPFAFGLCSTQGGFFCVRVASRECQAHT